MSEAREGLDFFHVVATDVVAPTSSWRFPRSKLVVRFEACTRREWIQLFTASALCNEKAASVRQRQCRRGGDDVERRVRRAERLVHVGELSSARQVLEGAALAPVADLSSLEMFFEIMGFQRVTLFELDENVLSESPFCTLRGRWWPIRHDVGTFSSIP